jgi:ABC-type thiamin/hydroxymethylpyrimidine transport system permease subunit
MNLYFYIVLGISSVPFVFDYFLGGEKNPHWPWLVRASILILMAGFLIPVIFSWVIYDLRAVIGLQLLFGAFLLMTFAPAPTITCPTAE